MFIENGFQKSTPTPKERNINPSTDYTDSEKMRYQSRCQLEDRGHLAPTELENEGCRFYKHRAPNGAFEIEQ
jgi:hypothetical protein